MRNFIIILLSIISIQAYSQNIAVGSADSVTTSQSFIPWWQLQNGVIADGQNIETELCSDQPSDTLKFRDFGFNIPSNATILGVQINMGKSASSPNEVLDFNVSLINNGTISNNKADTSYWNTISTYTLYGSDLDTWGANLTPAIINNPNFGFSLQTQASTSTCLNAWIDYATLLVNYSVPFNCDFELDIEEEQQCSNFFMFNPFQPPFDEDITGFWYFGEGEVIEGGYSNEHWYETPGTYEGYVEFSTLECDTIIEFTIEALMCDNCDDEVYFFATDDCGEFALEVGVNQPNLNAIWYFGDGESATTGTSTLHTYEEAGTYNGYVWYTSDVCGGMEIPFTIVAEGCDEDCLIEVYWEEITCEYYQFFAETNSPNAIVNWFYDNELIGIGNSIYVSFPTDGVHQVCAVYETPNCPEGVELCFSIDIDHTNCLGCPQEVYYQQVSDECGLYGFTIEGDSTGYVDWTFGDGASEGGSDFYIEHMYAPGTYSGYAVYSSEVCNTKIIFDIVVEECDECEANPISMSWSIEQFGSDQAFAIGLFEVGEDINSLEAIDAYDCFASDFSECQSDYCLEDGCYAFYISSASEFELSDFNLYLANNGIEVDYIINGISPTVGFYAYFSLGDVSCAFNENCILDLGYETLADGSYIFSALTNSTSDVVWDFGDGNTGIGWPIAHTYDEPGEYEVCVSFIDDNICSNSSVCGTVIVEGEEDCSNVTITIEHDLDDDTFEQLDISLLFPNLEFDNQTITLFGQLDYFTLEYCLPDGCYEFGISPTVSVNDLSSLTISVASNGIIIGEGSYDEETNSVGLTFGLNDDDCNTNSIAENEIGNLIIFPNPVQNELTIIIENKLEDLEYSLVNILGQPVKTGQLNNSNNRIHVSDLAEGQYQLVVTNDNFIQTRTISITR